MINREGVVLKDDKGELSYATIICVSKDVRDRFSKAVIEALLAEHSDAAGGDAA
jgi:hypothetical protein